METSNRNRQFVFDEEKCTGCFTCHIACMNAQESADAVSLRTTVTVRKEDEGYQKKICPGCLHCGTCISVCKSQALYRDQSTGLVLIHRENCVGCRACEKVCPQQVIHCDKEQKAVKCDGCITRLQAEKEPACVRNCPTGAIDRV